LRRLGSARSKRVGVLLLAFHLLLAADGTADETGRVLVGGSPPSRQFGALLGVTHAGPKYSLPTRAEPIDSLSEGADRIAALGLRTIKLWFNSSPATSYPNFAQLPQFVWPPMGPGREIPDLRALAAHPLYAKVFSRAEFDHILLVATEFTRVNWRDGLNSAERTAVEKEFADLTSYLIDKYEGTGKTFILQNWEGDNLLRLAEFDPKDWGGMVDGLIAYFKARQAGVERGRAGREEAGVQVLHAIEINWNLGAAAPSNVPVPEEWTVLNKIVRDGYDEQDLLVDLYSWSNWSANIPGEEHRVIRGLDYMRRRVPAAAKLAPEHIFLGEFGAREVSYMNPQTWVHDERSDAIHRDVVIRQLEYAWRWGVRHAVYWGLYANGLRAGFNFNPNDPVSLEQQQLTGTWLVRPPGPPDHPEYSFTGAHDALARLAMQQLYTDYLEDFSSVDSHNNNWAIAFSVPSWAEGATSRAYRGDAGQASLVYRFERDLRDLAIKAFGYQAATLDGRVTVAYSSDGRSWTPSTNLAIADVVSPDPALPVWRRFHLQPAGSIPAGIRYVRIELGPVGANWSTQLAEVRFLEAPARPDAAAPFDETGRRPLLVYALGGGGSAPGLRMIPDFSKDRLRLAFERRADPGLVYAVEATDDLASTAPWPVIWTSRGGENIPGPVVVEDEVPISSTDARLFRLRVGIQPAAVNPPLEP
jgi:hypothetical protein